MAWGRDMAWGIGHFLVVPLCSTLFSFMLCLQNTAMMLQNTAMMLQNTAMMLQNTAMMLQNTAMMLQNTDMMLQNTDMMLQNTDIIQWVGLILNADWLKPHSSRCLFHKLLPAKSDVNMRIYSVLSDCVIHCLISPAKQFINLISTIKSI